MLGPGPKVHIEVCSIECLELGFATLQDELDVAEERAFEEYAEQTKAMALSITCPTCNAGENQPCVTNFGNTSQRPHAPRIAIARKLVT